MVAVALAFFFSLELYFDFVLARVCFFFFVRVYFCVLLYLFAFLSFLLCFLVLACVLLVVACVPSACQWLLEVVCLACAFF